MERSFPAIIPNYTFVIFVLSRRTIIERKYLNNGKAYPACDLDLGLFK